jgi:WD40 repeat protein
VLPNGRVVSQSLDKTLRVWDTSSSACERLLEKHSQWVHCLAVLPDGRVVSGSGDKTLRVWDSSSGACERVLEGHSGRVICAAVLPDGRVVSRSNDMTLRAWDASSGDCERVLEGHTGRVKCVVVLPDGRVVSRSYDDTLRVWDASSGVCERIMKNTDAVFALLHPSCRGGDSLLAKAVKLSHSGPMLATSAARTHASEGLSASIAAGSSAAPVLVCGPPSGKVFFMTVVAAR